MSRIISFGWTADAVKARRKTVTRREWKDSYARTFKAGEELQAWTKVPFAGGKRFGTVRLTQAPYQESTGEIPFEDWDAEGFEFMNEAGITVDGRPPLQFWMDWRTRPRTLWVVRFEILELFE